MHCSSNVLACSLGAQDVKHLQNEVFFDVFEDIDCVIDPNGAVVRNDIRGLVTCRCNMSGTPDIALFFSDPKVSMGLVLFHVNVV